METEIFQGEWKAHFLPQLRVFGTITISLTEKGKGHVAIFFSPESSLRPGGSETFRVKFSHNGHQAFGDQIKPLPNETPFKLFIGLDKTEITFDGPNDGGFFWGFKEHGYGYMVVVMQNEFLKQFIMKHIPMTDCDSNGPIYHLHKSRTTPICCSIC